MVKLVEEEGRTMFVCEVDENLTLDEFDTSNADNDEGISIETLGIQNIAANIVGEHECIYELRSVKYHVKLMVTSEANTQSDISVNSKFKAEIAVPVNIANDVKTNAGISIQCPNSGEQVVATASRSTTASYSCFHFRKFRVPRREAIVQTAIHVGAV